MMEEVKGWGGSSSREAPTFEVIGGNIKGVNINGFFWPMNFPKLLQKGMLLANLKKIFDNSDYYSANTYNTWSIYSVQLQFCKPMFYYRCSSLKYCIIRREEAW